ncbi:MAG TPA: hypothetical protein PK856_12005, partial [Vitreoscilla sp.]|nr:hypothetical protein [Vitreoscilla sp.]
MGRVQQTHRLNKAFITITNSEIETLENQKRPVNPSKGLQAAFISILKLLFSVLVLPNRGCRASLHWFSPRWRSSLVRFP